MATTVSLTGTVTDDLGQQSGVTGTITLHDGPTAPAVSPTSLPASGGRVRFSAVSDRPLTWDVTASEGTLTPVADEPGVYDYAPA